MVKPAAKKSERYLFSRFCSHRMLDCVTRPVRTGLLVAHTADSYICGVRSISNGGSSVQCLAPGTFSGTRTVLLVQSTLLSLAAIGSTTAALSLLIAFGVACLLVVQRRALARASASARSATARTEELERELAKLQDAEQEWPRREERFRTPLDQVQNYAIILLNAEGKPTSWNTGIRSVLGYERAEFLQLSASDLYPPEDRESGAPAADLAQAVQHGRFTVDRWLVRKDGSRFWGSISTNSVHDRQGRLLGFARRLRDLSENKQVKEQLSRKQYALELALEAAGLGTWEHDLSTGEGHWDARAKALFGWPADEPVAEGQWAGTIHPEDRQRTLERWERAVRDRTPYSAEYRVIWPDGSVHWIMAVGRCPADPAAGTPLRFTGVVLDLTERRRAEERLQETLRLEAVGRLAGGIAHDLNNMLAAILGFGEILGRSLEPNDPRIADVEQISRAAERSARLTRQLLAFARRELIQPRALDINAVIRHAEGLLPPILGENIELILELAADLGAVYADARQVEQILLNLVLNARDAMPQGGRVTIETRTVQLGPGFGVWSDEDETKHTGRFAMLSVTDSGHGMDAATLQRIWEPFFTTKPPGQGTGLGLASVHGAVKQSGGFVWADSEPGRGTSVQVYWPEIPVGPEPIVEMVTPTVLEGGNETVLIVEDEDLVRAFALRSLRSLGYTCREARDAGEALRQLEGEHAQVDLVITDVVMPGSSGGNLGERLANMGPGIPTLYMSAFTDEDVIRRGLLEQGRPFLQKPFTIYDLAHKVRELLDAAASVRGQHQSVG
jgi:two-component system cell cycle sensor histidine kinase/response regulator CckA